MLKYIQIDIIVKVCQTRFGILQKIYFFTIKSAVFVIRFVKPGPIFLAHIGNLTADRTRIFKHPVTYKNG